MTKRKIEDRPDLKMVTPNAAAIDIGSTMHMAAVDPDSDAMPVRAFGTFTQDLHDLAEWFRSCGVTSVAMESTGVYWIPAFEILEAHGFEVILVNARYALYGWPLGKSFIRVGRSGRSRPCIRRPRCSVFAAARPDEVSRRSGPDQWHAL